MYMYVFMILFNLFYPLKVEKTNVAIYMILAD